MAASASVLRALASAALAWLVIQSLLFALVQSAPGGPAAALAGDFATRETQAAVAQSFALDRPVAQQYAAFVIRMAQGDWGQSYYFRRPVAALIAERLAPTLALMLSALAIAGTAGSALGLWAAAHRKGGTIVAVAAAAAYALPMFWVGQLLMLGLGFELRWFPLSGLNDPRETAEGWAALPDVARHAALPVLTLAVQQTAFFVTVAFAKAKLELAKSYPRAARARGIRERAVVWAHVARNVSPQVAVAALNRIGTLFTGAVLVETLFAWPGLGRLMSSALLNRDHPVLFGVFGLVTASVIVSSALADAVQARLDPRIGTDGETR
ncbi:MAG: ABC transporter permease [Ramlibacter sp.]